VRRTGVRRTGVRPVGDELRRLKDGRWRRHGDLRDHLPDAGNALRVRNAADKQLADFFVHGIKIQLAEFRQVLAHRGVQAQLAALLQQHHRRQRSSVFYNIHRGIPAKS